MMESGQTKEQYLHHSRKLSAWESNTGVPYIDEILGTFGVLARKEACQGQCIFIMEEFTF